MTRQRPLLRATDRLHRGSRLVTAQLLQWAVRRCRRSHRSDLTGWRAWLGPALCGAILGAGLYALTWLVHRRPALMWILTAAWALAAWYSGRPPKAAPEDPEDTPDEQPTHTELERWQTLLLQLTGDRPGVHLRTVLQHLQQHPDWADCTVPELRAQLEALGVPTEPKVKVGGTPTRGVTRAALLSLSPEREATPAPAERLPA
ncbi:hypothetical protein ACIQXD_05050 [Streptomyces uncialis]|uniref:hypothetical protein n=1 Tax=Streptomyces uncialis TaxID=1048205 RepID=UPI0037F1CDDC